MKTKKRNLLFPLFLMMTFVLFITGCEDVGEDNVNPYSIEDMAGTFENEAERIKVELSSDESAILTKVEGNFPGQDEEVDENATWEIKKYEAPAGVSSEDSPLSIIIDHSNSQFDDDPYVLIIESVDKLKDHWQKTLSRVEDDGEDDGEDNGDEDKEYSIGDEGPAGGLIFYKDENNDFDWTYMEVWVDNLDEIYGAWHEDHFSHTSGTSTDFGTGQANTDAMSGSEHEAAEIIRNATYGGYDDWFLPSRDELLTAYENLPSVESNYSYWSSSEAVGDDDGGDDGFYTGHGLDYGAWRVNLNETTDYHLVNWRKSGQAHVLAVRSF